MTIEVLIGALVVLGVVAYLFLKDKSSDSTLEPTLKADKVEAEKTAEPAKKEAPAKKATKKAATKKVAKVDLDAMKKDELLAHAKANGIKANASMNKAALITAIKNG